ncbi:MAG: 1-acyl-sn-glycerol-3-phosphate acyltransferase [Chlamydiia bacterium]|nr:1-acyl-sn-glycerol-3-phosphate acyltransferase [Chlamydiia bacterium]
MIRTFSIIIYKIYLILFHRLKVYGKEHIPKGGAIIASNHASFFDPPVIGVSCPHTTHILARDSLFAFPPFGWFLKKLGAHPIQRGKGNLQTIKKTRSFIRMGEKLVIFPEGKRSSDGKLGSGLRGVGLLVYQAGATVIPTYIHGTFEAWNKHHKCPRLGKKIACVFGKPLDFSDYINENGDNKKMLQKKIVDQIMEAIANLQKWYLSGANGSPP